MTTEDNNLFFEDSHGIKPYEKPSEQYDISTPEKKAWCIISYLEKNPFSTAYQIRKETKINKGQISQKLKELLFARIICVMPGKDSLDRPCERYYLPHQRGEGEVCKK